ncbi:hypothetical protein [Thauera sp. 63]|uniref:hypothetical protein n=1 Tax=Thauera sp. 63 TaxID=497321 RepID=UPI0002CD7DB3|nr:hypothetical protein [Thauera sp. 63]ENO78846.1 hypothetical protein C664_06483 [Thauera sp. 63]
MFNEECSTHHVAMTPALQTGLQALSRHFAGRHVRVPRDPSKLLRMVPSDLDAASAAEVCAAVGGSRLYARKATRTLAEARNSVIRVRRAHGATLEALAEEFGLSARQIANILKDTPK